MRSTKSFNTPSQEVLASLIEAGYKVNLIPHRGAWSVHLFSSDLIGASSDRAFGGTARTKELALAKAISEYVERQAMEEFKRTNPSVIDSSGFAARPLQSWSPFVKHQTRSSAMLEAMERYYGYHWWEDSSIGHLKQELNDQRFQPLIQLDMVGKFRKILLVQIKTTGFEDILILIGLQTKGFLIGCAAGWAWERSRTVYRATVELMRHYHILNQLHRRNEKPSSAYSEKLSYLASGAADQALNERLTKTGMNSCNRPKMAFDGSIAHKYARQYYVHHFVFEDQPDILAYKNNIII